MAALGKCCQLSAPNAKTQRIFKINEKRRQKPQQIIPQNSQAFTQTFGKGNLAKNYTNHKISFFYPPREI